MSYPVGIQEHGQRKPILRPVRLSVLSRDAQGAKIELGYDGGQTVTIEMLVRANHLRMTVVAVKPQDGIGALHWGPYATSMEGPIAEYLGLNRSDRFTIGLMGLDMNTDSWHIAQHAYSGEWLPASIGGSFLRLLSQDRSRTKEAVNKSIPLQALAVPNLTLVGSSVALFGCLPTDELQVIEAIELGEGLPHPMLDGQWAKRAPRARESEIWADYTEANIAQWIGLTKEVGMKMLCRRRPFSNWGHYDPDPEFFPRGLAGMRACSELAASNDIRTTMYSMTTFIKPVNRPEPYITPVPDARFQIIPPATTLATALDDSATNMVLAGGDVARLNLAISSVKQQVVRIDQELIGYETARADGKRVVLEGCKRGLFDTKATAHAADASVARLCFTSCFYPGTEEMNAEVATNIVRVSREAGLKQVTFDGLESTFFTGHDHYSWNYFVRAVYDQMHGDDITYTSSGLNQYSWHILTYESWGEYDLLKGFRGTVLDHRLNRQIQLRRNHMPNKMGQYYPDKTTTLEDIEWLMARAAGYDAGVDLNVRNNFFENPHKDKILAAVRHWEEARSSGAFTDDQKLRLRQTDCLFTLVEKSGGGWEPRFVRRWRDSRLKIEPPSAVAIKVLAAENGQVAPCSIDFDWAHDPGIYQQSCLTDDLVHKGGLAASDFEVTPPWPLDSKILRFPGHALMFVMRLPADAPCAIRNPRLVLDTNQNKQICIPITLQPGQYISTTHEIPVVCVYDAKHQLLREVPIRELPRLSGPKPLRVQITAEPTDPAARPDFRVNLRFHSPLATDKE